MVERALLTALLAVAIIAALGALAPAIGGVFAQLRCVLDHAVVCVLPS